MFAGCSGRPSAFPAGASGYGQVIPVIMRDETRGTVGRSSQALLYVSSLACYSSCDTTVDIYTFPQGELIGTWAGTGVNSASTTTECSDDAGDVFVAGFSYSKTYGYGGELFKFTHGSSTPVTVLSDGGEIPVACSVDPVSGSLAVVNGYNAGTLLIYKNASGSPKTYSYPGASLSGVSYDRKGDVFVDGLIGSKFVLAELLKRREVFENIALNLQPGGAGQLAWDEDHLTLGLRWSIYRFDIKGRSGNLVGVTQLKGLKRLQRIQGGITQYWIVGKQIVAAYSWKPCRAICTDEGGVGTWHYPSGRVIANGITPSLSPPTGMALSFTTKPW